VTQEGYDYNIINPTPVEYVRSAKNGYAMYSVNMWKDPKVLATMEHDEDVWSICAHEDLPNLDVYFKADKKDEGILDQAITIFSLDCRSIDYESYGVTGFIVAMDKFGNVVNALPHSKGAPGGLTLGRSEGISMYNTTTAILAAVHGGFLWNYVTGELEALPFVADTHSLVYRWDDNKYYGMYSDAESRKTHSPQGMGAFDGNTGANKMDDPAYPGWGYLDDSHLNYLTVDGPFAYGSSRGESTLYKINMRTNQKVWALGGRDSNFTIYGINGQPYDTKLHKYAPERYPWNHQHKFQYLGDGFFSLFDNNVGTGHDQVEKPWGKSSRLVVLHVNEETMQAREVFSHPTGDSAMSYGGTDPLPSGNVLATSYVDWVHPADPDHRYHCNVWEVNMETHEVEWRLGFRGLNPLEPVNLQSPYPHYFYDPTNPDGHVPTGWNIYTADRAYPTVFARRLCLARGGAALRFSPFNTVRTQSDHPGAAALFAAGSDSPAAQKAFLYQRGWLDRPEEIEVPPPLRGGPARLTLNNRWGNAWEEKVDLAALPACNG